jgi:hypothetical protein
MTTCLSNALASAITRLESTLEAQAPFLSNAVYAWMCRISPTGEPAGHFEHPRMFPVLQLPEWVAEGLGVPCDRKFHEAVTYSSVCGYYHTRLIDNFMDGDAGMHKNVSLLPAGGILVGEFQFEYQKYFSPGHEFWNHFRSIWLAAAESAGHDAALHVVTPESFELVSSRKFAAAGIPVAAACLFYEHPRAIARWDAFVRSLGRWSQMFDDVLDWHEDRERCRSTWFLSEAQRRKRAAESVEEWVVREGNAWGFGLLDKWMENLLAQADCIGSSCAHRFLQQRQMLSQEKERDLTAGYVALAQLGSILQLT